MLKKLTLVTFSLFFSLFLLSSSFSSAFALVVSSYDQKNACTLYKALSSGGNTKIKPNEEVVTKKEVYGFSIKNLEIDFHSREVLVDAEINIILGFNTPLGSGNMKISDKNPSFGKLINQANQLTVLFQSICVSQDNYIVYSRTEE